MFIKWVSIWCSFAVLTAAYTMEETFLDDLPKKLSRAIGHDYSLITKNEETFTASLDSVQQVISTEEQLRPVYQGRSFHNSCFGWLGNITWGIANTFFPTAVYKAVKEEYSSCQTCFQTSYPKSSGRGVYFWNIKDSSHKTVGYFSLRFKSYDDIQKINDVMSYQSLRDTVDIKSILSHQGLYYEMAGELVTEHQRKGLAKAFITNIIQNMKELDDPQRNKIHFVCNFLINNQGTASLINHFKEQFSICLNGIFTYPDFGPLFPTFPIHTYIT